MYEYTLRRSVPNGIHKTVILMLLLFYFISLFVICFRSNSRLENIVASLIASYRAMRLDPVEYNLVLTLILCRPGM